MRIVTKCAAQGDVMFRKVQSLPAGTVQDKSESEESSITVAHSETGHNHVAVASKKGEVSFFKSLEVNALLSYLRLDSGTHIDIEHKRSFDTHETLRLLGNPGDIWEVRRQREWTPEGWRRVED